MINSNSYKQYMLHLSKLLVAANNLKLLHQTIVNGPFYDKLHTTNLDLGIIVLTLHDNATNQIDRIAHSQTSPARDALQASPKPFKKMPIPFSETSNLLVKAIKAGKHQKTADWQYLFTPALHPEEARFTQAEAGMGCSFVYPLIKSDGALIFSFYQTIDQIGDCHQSFMSAYANLVDDALQNHRNQ